MKKTSLILMAILVIVFIGGVFALANFGSKPKNSTAPITKKINNFKECETAGNPIMESFPRKCKADGFTYIEEISIQPEGINSKMTEEQAKQIAQKTCIKGGESIEPGMYNEITKTWWFDANLNSTKEGCNPACVVSEDTNTAEINWRCTGLLKNN